jgi:GxxExxY protein
LLESVYETILFHELKKLGVCVTRQQAIPLIYEDLVLEDAFRADLIVENKVIIEVKSAEQIAPVHHKQLLTYLKLADMRLGLLINFGEKLIKNGIRRVANGLEDGEMTNIEALQLKTTLE